MRDGSLTARGVYGFWPAHADGDDVVLDEGTRFSFLRQQSAYGDSRPNRSLADYVAPDGDHLGAFAVGIHGADELAARFEAEHDDYSAIMAKALADRLAEAFAEWLHERARREWYETGDELSERGSDRRALPRHPAGVRLPGVPGPHREAQALRAARRRGARPLAHRELRDAAGRRASPASISRIRQARYFSVGRIGRDQVADYAAPQGRDVAEAERWLGPNLAYTPDALTPASTVVDTP